MDKKGSLFSIGRTARLFRLSVSSLRHYEAIGLVRPAWTDPASGYRYYSLAQFEVLNTIRYLRTLDMPLEQIRSFLENRDPAWMEGRLRQQQKEVRRRIRELELAEGKITSRLEQLQEARKGTKGVITLTESPALRLVWVRESLAMPQGNELEGPIRRLEQEQPEALVFLGKVGLGITADHLLAGKFTQYDGLFLQLDPADRYAGKILELPSQPCVRLLFQGSHQEAPDQYRKLLAFLTEKKLQPVGFSREVALIDAGLSGNPEEYVTEIRIPVE